MSEKYKKISKKLSQTVAYFTCFILFVQISAYAWLVCVPDGILSSAVWIKICAITGGIKKSVWIFKKKKIKHGKIVLLGKNKLENNEFLILIVLDKFLIFISHDGKHMKQMA